MILKKKKKPWEVSVWPGGWRPKQFLPRPGHRDNGGHTDDHDCEHDHDHDDTNGDADDDEDDEDDDYYEDDIYNDWFLPDHKWEPCYVFCICWKIAIQMQMGNPNTLQTENTNVNRNPNTK